MDTPTHNYELKFENHTINGKLELNERIHFTFANPLGTDEHMMQHSDMEQVMAILEAVQNASKAFGECEKVEITKIV